MLDPKPYGRSAVEEAIDEWIIGRNGERDRLIMRMYLFDGLTFEKMQKRLDENDYPLSVDRIKKIVLNRSEQLQSHIKHRAG